MMVDLRWIYILLFLIRMHQFTVTGQFSSFTVRDGDDVTLPCGNVRDDPEKCDRTTWLFSGSGNTAAVELVNLGKIKPESNSKSHRLSVTEKCSLVIKKVTYEDVGLYTCRQFDKSGQQQVSDSVVVVSVVTTPTALFSSFTVRHGDEVTLPCKHVINHQDRCNKITWILSGSENTAVALFELGKIKTESNSKSHRLSVTENCSLVIKKVTGEDVGQYNCKNFGSRQEGEDALVYLYVVNLTEHKVDDKVTLTCSVWTRGHCGHTVKWLNEGRNNDFTDSSCSASVTFIESHQKHYESLKCEVTDANRKAQQFTFRPQPSGEDITRATSTTTTAAATLTSTTTTTTTTTTIITATTTKSTTIKSPLSVTSKPTTAVNLSTSGRTNSRDVIKQQAWPVWIIVLAALLLIILIIVGVLIRWKKTKDPKLLIYENAVLKLNPAVTQSETSQRMSGPEDAVCYDHISYAIKSKRKASGQEETVNGSGPYRILNVSSSSDLTDLSNPYATINFPNTEGVSY
ncbi:uncharacterized protein [Channa argus]|uniref:uncharacterized protein isoform X2 n=1 Tax=Channa argus TaxID=215402 RepID=UPI003520C6B9